MLIYQVKEGTSKQAWLGSVSLCQRCGSQQPKGGFKVVNREEVCACCQKEIAVVDFNPK
jgi:formylmethanofuran dehydrogenase subunit E